MKLHEYRVGGTVFIIARKSVWDRIKSVVMGERLRNAIRADSGEARRYRGELLP